LPSGVICLPQQPTVAHTTDAAPISTRQLPDSHRLQYFQPGDPVANSLFRPSLKPQQDELKYVLPGRRRRGRHP
jgi:hypothetical protein